MLKNFSPVLLLILLASEAAAHEGHGMPGSSHWHASDVLLPLLVVACAALGWWLGRRK
ncbi:hypothetical protein [Roseateles sp.]|jgi:hypothetical protein|uniref:hypothetical protein n=1 Tax=Roseateles sp. TaxID=1971397 RepID=UPI00391AE830